MRQELLDKIGRLAPGTNLDGDCFVIEEKMFSLPDRKSDGDKRSYPNVLIIGGSETMCGAPLMALYSAKAALKGGAGLVTLAVPDCLKALFIAHTLQNTLLFLDSHGGRYRFCAEETGSAIKGRTSLAVGMGMGAGYGEILKLIEYLLGGFTGTVIIDADGLNAMCGHTDILAKSRAKVIITPHMREFMRLTGKDDLTQLKINRIAEAKEFALCNNTVVVLKDALTVITDGKRVALNITGTPALSKGGSGDILSGLIAALAGQIDPFEAACYGAYVLGRAGENAQKICGQHSVTAEDIIKNIIA